MISIDFETRSKAIIQKTGAWKYAADPSTDVLCMGYAVNDGPVELWVPGEAFPFSSKSFTQELLEAHYSFFEYSIWKNVMVKKYGWPEAPLNKWVCSASIACSHALPRGLADVASALSLKHQKDLEGKRTMMKLSRPRTKYKDDPCDMWCSGKEDFRILYQYCKDDVAVERELTNRLKPLTEKERAIWLLDQTINERGIRVDLPAVKAALKILEEYCNRLLVEFEKITGLESPAQRDKFVLWLKAQGLNIKSLVKNEVLTALEGKLPDHVRRALEIRQSISKTSTAKYQAVVEAVSEGDRLRGLLTYHGASTGRWVGQLVQPQNFPKNNFRGDIEQYFKILKMADLEAFEMCYPDVTATLSSTIRGIFIPSEGHTFFGGDYAAIEARVLFWLASEGKGLNMFRLGQDIYKDLAATIYQIPIEQVTKEQRELGKRGILGAGYGIGWNKFQATCWDFGRIKISEDLAQRTINTYRTKYRTVPVLWQLQELAAKQAIETKKPVTCGKVTWGVHDKFLFCRLPSGRCLAYYDPKIERVQTSWGEARFAVTFMAVNSLSKKWERDSTYGGKIVENLCQAVARDIMAEAIYRVEKNGFKVVLTVHDELLSEKVSSDPEKTQHEFATLLVDPPKWAEGLPIKAEAWRGQRYTK